eukprot:12413997-Karenia_brevis.AAC.1
MQPRASSVLGVEGQTDQEEQSNQSKNNSDNSGGQYEPEWWGLGGNIGAITKPNNPNIQCYKGG